MRLSRSLSSALVLAVATVVVPPNAAAQPTGARPAAPGEIAVAFELATAMRESSPATCARVASDVGAALAAGDRTAADVATKVGWLSRGAEALEKCGNMPAAEAYAKRGTALAEGRGGRTAAELVDPLSRLAAIRRDQGDDKGARELFARASAIADALVTLDRNEGAQALDLLARRAVPVLHDTAERDHLFARAEDIATGDVAATVLLDHAGSLDLAADGKAVDKLVADAATSVDVSHAVAPAVIEATFASAIDFAAAVTDARAAAGADAAGFHAVDTDRIGVLFARLLDAADTTYGHDAPSLEVYLRFALQYAPRGDRASLSARLLALLEKNYGADSDRLRDALDRRAEALAYDGATDDADAVYARLQALVERIDGADSASAMTYLIDWAKFRRENGHAAGLVAMYERLLTIAEAHPADAERALDEIDAYTEPPSIDALDISAEDLAPDRAHRYVASYDETRLRAAPEDAVRLLTRAVALREGRGDKPYARITTLDALVVALDDVGRRADADAADARATAIVAGEGDANTLLDRYIDDAVASIVRGRADRADRLIDDFVQAAAKVDAPDEAVATHTLVRVSDVVFSRGEIVRGERLVRAVVDMAERHPFATDAMADFFQRVAELYRTTGDADATERAYAKWSALLGQDAAAIDKRLEFLGGWGGMRMFAGDLPSAEAILNRALVVARAKGPDAEAKIIGSLATVVAQQDAGRAEPLIARMLVLAGQSTDAATSCAGLAGVLGSLGETDRARTLYERATRANGSLAAWESYGLFLESRGEWAGALAALQRAHAAGGTWSYTSPPPPPPPAPPAPPEPPPRDPPAPPLSSSSEPSSPPSTDTPPPMPDTPDVPDESGGPSSTSAAPLGLELEIARVLARAGRVAEARAKLAEARASADWPPTFPDLAASVYVALGDEATAATLANESLTRLSGSEGAATFRGAVVGPEMMAMYAAEGYVLGGDAAGGVPWMDRGQNAIDRGLAEVAMTGSERQNEMIGVFAGVLPGAIAYHVAAAPNDPAARRLALRTLLRAKGRALDAASQAMGALRGRLDAEDQALFDALAAKRLAIAKRTEREATGGELARLKADAEQLETNLMTRSAAFRVASGQTTVEEVAARLPAHSALLEIARVNVPAAWRLGLGDSAGGGSMPAIGRPRYVAYVLSPHGDVSWADLGDARAIDTLAGTLRDQLSSPDTDPVPAARALDEKVMQKVRPLLGDATHVIVSPDGALAFVPFGALVDEGGGYLQGRYVFTYVTSGRDLLRMHAPTPARSGAVVLANPDYGTYVHARSGMLLGHLKFLPLAATQAEGEQVAAALHATLLTGAKANEPSLRALHGPSVLHVATHGFFLARGGIDAEGRDARAFVIDEKRRTGASSFGVPDNPLLRAGFALAGANSDDDAIVTALEASSLDLYGTKLVVLSACETGLGDTSDGEGVIGMRRALELAGAESLVMTLWKVDDRATQALMARYYGELARGAGRTEALWRAQLAGHAEHAHPYYWAAFVPIGDWRTLAGGDAEPTTAGTSPEVFRVAPGPHGCGCRLIDTRAASSGASASLLVCAIATLAAARRARRRRVRRVRGRRD